MDVENTVRAQRSGRSKKTEEFAIGKGVQKACPTLAGVSCGKKKETHGRKHPEVLTHGKSVAYGYLRNGFLLAWSMFTPWRCINNVCIYGVRTAENP